jgi:hypothetical protein
MLYPRVPHQILKIDGLASLKAELSIISELL